MILEVPTPSTRYHLENLKGGGRGERVASLGLNFLYLHLFTRPPNFLPTFDAIKNKSLRDLEDASPISSLPPVSRFHVSPIFRVYVLRERRFKGNRYRSASFFVLNNNLCFVRVQRFLHCS